MDEVNRCVNGYLNSASNMLTPTFLPLEPCARSGTGSDFSAQKREGKGFILEARRWIVERTFAWLGKFRRLSNCEVKINPKFKELIHPLTQQEQDILEKDILDKGCLDALKTWNDYLIDGHHRYDICKKHNITFKTETLLFEDEESAMLWMINNQMGRAKKRQACGQGGVLLKADLPEGNKGQVRDIIAKKAGVGARAVDKFKTIQENASKEVVQSLCEGTAVNGKKLSIDGVYRDLRKDRRQAELSTTEFPEGKYRVIYADPPWKYGDELIETYGGAEKHYPTMRISELCDLPVGDIADENSVLFLWVTSPLLEDSFKLINSWGFNYKSSFVWDKVKHNMGHYNSVRHELLLIATKGSCTPDEKKLFDSVQSIERTRHSEKPEEFRQIIETLYKHGNKVELFARKKTSGWEVYGNEVQIA